MEPISIFKIVDYDDQSNIIISSFSHGRVNDKLYDLLRGLRKSLGVEGYYEYADGVKWLFKGKLYSCRQIERMFALKAFL